MKISLMKTRTTILLSAGMLLLAASFAISASEAGIGPSGANVDDKASLQRGAKWFVNYCLACHSLSYMRYNRLAEDLQLSEEDVLQNLIFSNAKIGDTMDITMDAVQSESWFSRTPPGSFPDRTFPWSGLVVCLLTRFLPG